MIAGIGLANIRGGGGLPTPTDYLPPCGFWALRSVLVRLCDGS